MTVLFGTERDDACSEGGGASNSEQSFDLQSSFWFSVTRCSPANHSGPPKTIGGKIVAVFVMFMGVTIFAMFTGTVSAFMVERLRTESGKKLNPAVYTCAELMNRSYASHLKMGHVND